MIGVPQASFTRGGVGCVADARQATVDDPPTGGTAGAVVALENVIV